MGLESSFCCECMNKNNFPPQMALELPKNKTLKLGSTRENTLYLRFTGVSSTFAVGGQLVFTARQNILS